MLSFKIVLNDLTHLPDWDLESGVFGKGYINPYHHEAVEFYFVFCEELKRAFFVCREKDFRFSAEQIQKKYKHFPIKLDRHDYEDAFRAISEWPLNFICIELCLEEAPRISVSCGTYHSVALYLSTYANYVVGHWDPEALCDLLPELQLNYECVAQKLLLLSSYGTETFFKNISRLPDRGCYEAILEGANVKASIKKPTPLPYRLAGTPPSGADVLKIYDEALKAAINTWISPNYSKIGVELSGGLDSSNLALALRSVYARDICSYIVLAGGVEGDLQREKRPEIVNKIRAHDTCFEGVEYPPLCNFETKAVWPDSHYYMEAEGHKCDLLRAENIPVIMTGQGGDLTMLLHASEDDGIPLTDQELTLNNFISDEYLSVKPEPDWPMGILNGCTVSGLHILSTHFLRHGIWAIHPFASLDLIDFCRSLPPEWRKGRKIMKDRLLWCGLSEHYITPKESGHFLNIFLKGTPTIVEAARKLVRNSILVDCGIVDRQKLHDACSREYPDREDDMPLCLLIFVRLEHFLRKHIRKLRFN